MSKHLVKIREPQATYPVYITFSHSDAEKKLKDKTTATKWLAKNGWKYMTSRTVYVHRERQYFYAKSIKAYDAGRYAQLSVLI